MNIKNFYLVYGKPQMSSVKGEASMKEYNFSNMNFGELTNLREALEQEIKARKEQEFNRLVENVCEAIAELRKAFPSAKFEVDGTCDVCFETTEIKVFDYCTKKITSDFFSMY